MIGFVALASYPRLINSQIQIFNAVSNIFGADAIKNHCNFLLTFADGQLPSMLQFLKVCGPIEAISGGAYPYNKFHCSGFFGEINQSAAGKCNRKFWDLSLKNFQTFFSLLKLVGNLLKFNVRFSFILSF